VLPKTHPRGRRNCANQSWWGHRRGQPHISPWVGRWAPRNWSVARHRDWPVVWGGRPDRFAAAALAPEDLDREAW